MRVPDYKAELEALQAGTSETGHSAEEMDKVLDDLSSALDMASHLSTLVNEAISFIQDYNDPDAGTPPIAKRRDWLERALNAEKVTDFRWTNQ